MATTLLTERVQSDRDGASRRTRRSLALALAGLMLLGLILRILLAGRSGLWRDEALFLWIVRIPTLRGMLAFLAEHESHPPLFYLLMRGWLGLFGDSEPAALALPVLLGVALVPMAYAAGARFFSRDTGLIAAVLVAFSPLLADHAALVRPYSLLPLLCLASVSYLWSGLEGGGWKAWLGHGLTTLAMLLTHNWSWLVLVAEGVFVALFTLARGWRRALAPGLTWIIMLACYAPWVPFLLNQCRHAGHDGASIQWLLAVFSFAESVTTLAGLLALPLLLVFLGLIWLALREPGTERERADSSEGLWKLLLLVAIPALTFALSVALSFKTFLILQRCQVMTAPCFILAASCGIAALRQVKLHLVLAVAVLFALGDWSALGTLKSNAREVAEVVAARARPTDLVVVAPPWLASSFNYYYSGNNPQLCYAFEGRVGAIWYDDLRARLADPRALESARLRLVQSRRAERRVWLVTDRPGRSGPLLIGNRVTTRPDLGTFTEIGNARADQILDDLQGLYGEPSPIPTGSSRPSSSEAIYLRLFEPRNPRSSQEGLERKP
jgi:4-amino-4-deoxy-L-arabinose transferase-like glycosyltransferase